MNQSEVYVHNSGHLMDYSPTYMRLFEFEKFTSHDEWRRWMDTNWIVGYGAAFVYILFLNYGAKLMKFRHPWQIKRFAMAWNWCMAIFCFVGFNRSLPELVVSMMDQTNGFRNSVCWLDHPNSATSLWGLLFCFAKIAEFGDSVIRIFRKKPVRCFHWYRRLLICIYCWGSHGSNDPASRWLYTISYFVHGNLYMYYVVKGKYGSKRCDKLTLTYNFIIFVELVNVSTQIFINIYTLKLAILAIRCNRLLSNVFLALFIHCQNFVITFYHFMITLSPKPKID